MFNVDRAIGQFRKRLTSVIAVKGGHVEHCVQVFNMTIIHCSDCGGGQLFPKLSD